MELKSCPFCGSQVTMLKQGISCDSCLANMYRLKDDTDEELAEAWNKRALEPLSILASLEAELCGMEENESNNLRAAFHACKRLKEAL